MLEIAAREGVGSLTDEELKILLQPAADSSGPEDDDSDLFPKEDDDGADEGAALVLTSSTKGWQAEIEELAAMGFGNGLAIQAMRMTQGEKSLAIELLLSGAVDLSSRTAVVEGDSTGKLADLGPSRLGYCEAEIRSLLHLTAPEVPAEMATDLMIAWISGKAAGGLAAATAQPIMAGPQHDEPAAMAEVLQDLAKEEPSALLELLGTILTAAFAEAEAEGGEPQPEGAADEPQPEDIAAVRSGLVRTETADTGRSFLRFRPIDPPAADATNRADFLITGRDLRELQGSPRPKAQGGDAKAAAPPATAAAKRLPVWVACAPSSNHVIDVVLSVFVRRGRLPQPSEILFCTAQTTLEEIELLLRRFVQAGQNGLSDYIFTLADVHSLSVNRPRVCHESFSFCSALSRFLRTHRSRFFQYTKQCAVVDMLQSFLAELGTADAATLLVVSGKRRQVILNSLSQQSVDLPPLPTAHLMRAMEQAFTTHCGDTRAVRGTINGCGKTMKIMADVADLQAAAAAGATADEPPLYRRLPFRESSTASSLVCSRPLAHLPSAAIPIAEHAEPTGPGWQVAVLSTFAASGGSAGSACSSAVVHLDIGHIIPAAANTVLFELIVVGVIRSADTAALHAALPLPFVSLNCRDMASCRVYHRRKTDRFWLEIPNSIGDKTATALRFTKLLPTATVGCGPELLVLEKPMFTDRATSQIKMVKNTALEYVGKYLRAFKAQLLVYRSERYKLDYDPFQDAVPIKPEEIFALLVEYSKMAESPNWNTLTSFVHFMWPMLQMTVRWPIMQWQLEDLAPIWQNNFKVRACATQKYHLCMFAGNYELVVKTSLRPNEWSRCTQHSFVHMLIATSKVRACATQK